MHVKGGEFGSNAKGGDGTGVAGGLTMMGGFTIGVGVEGVVGVGVVGVGVVGGVW